MPETHTVLDDSALSVLSYADFNNLNQDQAKIWNAMQDRGYEYLGHSSTFYSEYSR